MLYGLRRILRHGVFRGMLQRMRSELFGRVLRVLQHRMRRGLHRVRQRVQRRMRRMVLAFGLPALLIVAAVLLMTFAYQRSYAALLHNVTTASEFNQDFKSEIDLAMYYYVIESQYSNGLPVQQVRDAQALAQELLGTTTQRDSRRAISRLCPARPRVPSR